MKWYGVAMTVALALLLGHRRHVASADPGSSLEDQTEILVAIPQAIENLDNSKLRVVALEQLINFSQERLCARSRNKPQTVREQLEEKAVAAIQTHTNFATVSEAINSQSETLHWWALPNVGTPWDEPQLPWTDLVPRIKQLATKASPQIRGLAQQQLKNFDGQSDFLEQCAADETSLENIMQLVYGDRGQGLAERLHPHVWRLLNHEQAEVRSQALNFIGSNRHRAPMWQFNFEDRVLRKVLELTASSSDAERVNAVYAIDGLLSIDPKSVRERMDTLVSDPCEDVRWRIPGALNNQLSDPEARAIVAKLLNDPSPNVRWFSVTTLGSKYLGLVRFETALQEFIDGDDDDRVRAAKHQLELATQKR